MKKDQYQRAILTIDEAVESLYRDQKVDGWMIDNKKEAEKYRESFDYFNPSLEEIVPDVLYEHELSIPVDKFHKERQNQWIMDKEYLELNVEEYILNRCKTNEEIERVKEELELYKERDLFPILRLMIYICDKMRQNGIVWGVGRGSSVSSYCLYLIGIHKINSIKFDLDIGEFLR